MPRRIIQSFTIIGGTILSTIRYFLPESNMTPLTWVLFAFGIIMVLVGVIWGILKPVKHISLRDKNTIVVKRQGNLAKLRDLIKNRLYLIDNLAQEASRLSLIEYRDKYLNHSKRYKILHLWYFRNEQQAILSSLAWCFFILNNLYFASLRENDINLKQIVAEYEITIANEQDKKLRKLLKGFWNRINTKYSIHIHKLLSISNSQIRNEPSGIMFANFGKDYADNQFSEYLNQIYNRISQLLNGDDLVDI